MDDFFKKREEDSANNFNNKELRSTARLWHNTSRKFHYQYMFQWLGQPIIQDPQDIILSQEIIWDVKPDLIIETGIARAGSLCLSASILASLCHSDSLNGVQGINRVVLGIDLDIRPHTKKALAAHPLSKMIHTIEGSSISPEVKQAVTDFTTDFSNILVILDSNHEENHVLEELNFYAQFVGRESAIIVMDTGIEFADQKTFSTERPWRPGSNPYTATKIFLKSKLGSNFSVDNSIAQRHLITCAPEGVLRRRC